MVDRKKSASESPEALSSRRPWRVRHIGAAVAFAVLVLGALGLFGDGPLSNASDASAALRVQYERFIRRNRPMELRIDARPAAGDEARIAVSSDYLHALRIDSILPYPEHLEETGQDVILVFRPARGSESVRITFDATPLHVGMLHAHVRVIGEAQDPGIRIDQVTYP
jgi:hypothetical protein